MFKFTIRELLLLTLIVAMGLGWWLTYQGMERRYARRTVYIEKLKDALRAQIGYNKSLTSAEQWVDAMPLPGDLPPELENEP